MRDEISLEEVEEEERDVIRGKEWDYQHMWYRMNYQRAANERLCNSRRE